MRSEKRNTILLSAALSLLLLPGCGSGTSGPRAVPEPSDAAVSLPLPEETDSAASVPESPPLPETETGTPSPRTEQEVSVAEERETKETLSPESCAGIWKIYSREAAGEKTPAEDDSLEAWIRIRENGRADYRSFLPDGGTAEVSDVPLVKNERGMLTFSAEVPGGTVEFELRRCKGNALYVDADYFLDGASAGSSMVFHRMYRPADPDEGTRALTQAELSALSADANGIENGFFLSTYARPEEIDWHQVFYQGAGLGLRPTEEQRAEYESYNGLLMTDVTAVRQADVLRYVWEKTGTDYWETRHPLWPDWYLTDDGQVYMFAYGDTNYQPIQFTRGEVSQDEYRLYYTRYDFETYGEREFEVTAGIDENGSWHYFSNVPADAPPEILLTIDFVDSREEAEAMGVTDFHETAPLASDEPYGWGWAVLTAKQDAVRWIMDRNLEDLGSDRWVWTGAFCPGENIASGVLSQGERTAVYINRPWHPSVRLTASRGGYFGYYDFGGENWLHLDDSDQLYLIAHDYEAEGRGVSYTTEAGLSGFLSCGSWFYCDPDGTPAALIDVFDYRTLLLDTGETVYQMLLDYTHTFTPEDGPPDTIALRKYDETDPCWAELADRYPTEELGAYALSGIQLDGEQHLMLEQQGALPGIFGAVLPECDGYALELLRFLGTAEMEGAPTETAVQP